MPKLPPLPRKPKPLRRESDLGGDSTKASIESFLHARSWSAYRTCRKFQQVCEGPSQSQFLKMLYHWAKVVGACEYVRNSLHSFSHYDEGKSAAREEAIVSAASDAGVVINGHSQSNS